MSRTGPSVEPGTAADAATWTLERAGWQSIVFAASPRRIDLLRLQPSWPLVPVRLLVHRNQQFEFVATPLERFLMYGGYSLETSIGGYDDSLLFKGADPDYDVELVWLDFERYFDKLDADDLATWLRERIESRRRASSAPILIADRAQPGDTGLRFNDRLQALLGDLPGVSIAAVSETARELGAAFFDERARTVTASTLSDRAAIEVARRLAFEWLPPRLEPRIKAIAVDLDGTLYSGVLGEDGAAKLDLQPAHRLIQETLVRLSRDGVLLVLVSRNEPGDVERLFQERPDFPLRADDFSFAKIGWEAKSLGLVAASEALRIGTGAILFVDDNPGEIAQAAAGVPGLRCLLAEDAQDVARALGRYPGLAGYRVLASDALRRADLSAQRTRAQLAVETADPDAYIRSLEVSLGFAVDDRSDLERLSELSLKTNQFNTALSRLSEVEVARRLAAEDCRTIAVSLVDRLSDAGTIAAIFTRRDGEVMVVDEIAISCRALGRGIEDFMICTALVRVGDELGVDAACFATTSGPRNLPARKWLDGLLGSRPADSQVGIRDLADRSLRMRGLVRVAWR